MADAASLVTLDDPRPPALAFDASRRAMAAGSQVLAGEVSSNFRLGIQPTPLQFDHADGAILLDADGNRLIGYYLGMGPMILGHTPADVQAAAVRQITRGILFGGQSAVETEAGRLVCEMVPCAERVRFTSSGSEAVQAALRLVRAATGRDAVVKFAGHHHGWFDNVLWSIAPPAGANAPVAGSRGQAEGSGAHLSVLPWNDAAALQDRLARRDVAAVIMKPAMYPRRRRNGWPGGCRVSVRVGRACAAAAWPTRCAAARCGPWLRRRSASTRRRMG